MTRILFSLLAAAFLCLLPGQSAAQAAFASAEFKTDWEHKNYELQAKDVVYKTASGLDLGLDILKAKNLSGKAPVVVYVHGGNWNEGNKTFIHRPIIESIFQRIIDMGFKVVSINYRLGRQVTPVNCAIADTKDAVRWVRKYSDTYQLDTTMIVLMGTSAGGHISQFAAYADDAAFETDSALAGYSSQVDGLIDCYGPVDILKTFQFKTGIKQKAARLVLKKLYNTFLTLSTDFSGYDYRTSRKEMRAFMRQYSTTSIQSPRNVPTLILQGTADKVVRTVNSKKLSRYLDQYGIENTLKLYKKTDHSFVGASEIQIENLKNSTENFLNGLK